MSRVEPLLLTENERVERRSQRRLPPQLPPVVEQPAKAASDQVAPVFAELVGERYLKLTDADRRRQQRIRLAAVVVALTAVLVWVR